MAKCNIKRTFCKIIFSAANLKGQSLVEIILGMTVAGILIGGASIAVALVMRSNFDAKTAQTASSLARELADNVSAIADSDWLKINNLTGGSQYYIDQSRNIVSGSENLTVENRNFTRYFSMANVSRDSCGIGDITTSAITSCVSGPGSSGVSDDPSTKKIIAEVDWVGGRSMTKTQYLSRKRNFSIDQSDWSAGSGQEGPITFMNSGFSTSTNINSTSTVGSIKLQTNTQGNLISSVFDTQDSGGAAFNAAIWQGSQPSGTSVKFQIASSNNSSGPWSYFGPDGSATTYYAPSGPNVSSQINLTYHNNQRYFRYKIFLYADAGQTSSPQVDDAIINFSY